MPGRLNRRAVFDPRFTRAFAEVGERAMTASVLVRRPKPGASTKWDYSTGQRPAASSFDPVWEGMARVQPNKDWRARAYTFGDETTVFQACRFQLPLVNGTWHVDDHAFRDEDQIIILATAFTALDRLEEFIFLIRNPLVSANAGLQNILADVDLKGGLSVGDS